MQSIMGVITEDRMDKVIRNMIDTIGVENTFKMVGDYDSVEKYFTDEDKINYIKNEFVKVNDGNYFNMEQIWERPILIKIENGERHQIEGLHKDIVSVVKYRDNDYTKYYPKYEKLSSETIDKLFRMMLGQYIKI
jgi:hypothetical protein